MAKICPLFSGSSGNCCYIGYAGSGILIDAGVSAKKIKTALDEIGVAPSSIGGILVTHEHIDHIGGLKVFSKQNSIPIFASEKTAGAVKSKINLEAEINTVESNLDLCGFSIQRFSTPHDCEGSSGYVISLPDNRKVAICTDLGHITEEIHKAVTGCDLVIIESNHDVRMVENGPYPFELKRRILSDNGHLSNDCCADEVSKLVKSGTTRVILAHLSKENNLPMLAEACTEGYLKMCGIKRNSDYILSVAKPCQNEVTIL